MKRKTKTENNPFKKYFRNKKLLEAALTHPSHRLSASITTRNNFQRLEFLGDAVLGLIISHKLFKELPNSQEGELSHRRSYLVSRGELAHFGLTINLGKWLILSGQKKVSHNPKILADSFEALIGALYLDRGYRITQKFLKDVLKKGEKKTSPGEVIKNPKGKLQEIVQKKWKVLPEYQTLPHKKGFRATVIVPKGKTFGIAINKKESQEIAALKMLKRLEKKG